MHCTANIFIVQGKRKKIPSKYSEKGSICVMRMRKPLRRAAGCGEEALTFDGLWALSPASQPTLDYIDSSFFTSLSTSVNCFLIISVTASFYSILQMTFFNANYEVIQLPTLA